MSKTYHSPRREKYATNLIKKEIGMTNKADWKLYKESGFESKDKQSCKINASLMKKHPDVKKKIETFREKLQKEIGDDSIVNKMKDILESGANRESIEVIKQYNSIMGNYAPKDFNVDVNKEREEVIE